MRRWDWHELLKTAGIGAGVAVAWGLFCLMVGSTGVHWPNWLQFKIRLESVWDSAMIGLALAAAGAVYQSILRNPLADPYLLGVSSGASLAAFVWRLPIFALATGSIGFLSAVSQQGFAFCGALLAILIVLGLAGWRGRIDPVTIVLIGVIVNAVNGSIYLLINALVHDLPTSGGPIAFLVGGVQVITHWQRAAVSTLILLGTISLGLISGVLNAAGLEDAEAHGLGISINKVRWIGLIGASLVTSAAVCVGGPIGFVGLVSPHIGRLFVGPDQRKLFPVSAAVGAILVMAADATSRYLAAENRLGTQLQIGILTGLLGGPFFLWLLLKSRSSRD
jgi:ABC-type Fe3+-siderophore transport system permease subunit